MVVWLSCGVDQPPSRYVIDRFLTGLELVTDDVYIYLVEQATHHGLLDLAYCIDPITIRTMPAYPDVSKYKNPGEDEYYYGYGYTIVSTGQKT